MAGDTQTPSVAHTDGEPNVTQGEPVIDAQTAAANTALPVTAPMTPTAAQAAVEPGEHVRIIAAQVSAMQIVVDLLKQQLEAANLKADHMEKDLKELRTKEEAKKQ